MLGMLSACPVVANPPDLGRDMELVVSGAVRQHCLLGAVSDFDFGDLERPGLNYEVETAFHCNVPFSITVTAERGALTHGAMPNGQGPYSGKVPYLLGVNMPVRYPSQSVLTRRFLSQDLTSGGSLSSNGGIAVDGLQLAIALVPITSDAGLLAGEYSETIRITVAPL